MATSTDSSAETVPWYHTIDLPSGPTPGEYDLRAAVKRVPLPDLAGKRCLDVGTHDGFWAYEMEKRGASEVLAIDIEDPEVIDWPEPRPVITEGLRRSVAQRKRAFSIAHDALGSKVQHRYLSVYEASPEAIGTFDFVFVGALLHHLRDPVGALIALRGVTDRHICVSAAISVSKSIVYPTAPVAELITQSGAPFWELPNIVGARRQLESAGFRVVKTGRPYLQPYGAGTPTERDRHFGRGMIRRTLGRSMGHFGVAHIGILAERLP
ncbi:MAG: class I SAM-dependent methyltransferase [Acidimicrobiales bacterium]